MKTRIPQLIPLIIATTLVLMSAFNVLMSNLAEMREGVSYGIHFSVEYGALALLIVWLSIILKRNIWIYVFLLALIASFFPLVSFHSLNLSVSFGSIKFDMIALPLTISHILVNMHAFSRPKATKVEVEESTKERVDYFVKRFENKTDDELLRMDESDLVPEAIEARKNILNDRAL